MNSKRFKAYNEEVIAAFQKKRDKADESWLVQLNRRKIWERSIELVENGVEPRDHRAVSDYLEMRAEDKDYLRAIKAKDADYFQGLFKFLNNMVVNPADSTVEFLSWMIGFPKRPFSEYIKGDADYPQETINDQLLTDKKGPNEPDVKPDKPAGRRQFNPLHLWMSGLVLLLLFAGLIWHFWPDNDCMYWKSDRYVESSCNIPRLDTPLTAFDQAKLSSFRRINKIDTLTDYAVGRFWYTRITKDSVEIFTARGVHPLYPDKELKKVTDYIVNSCNPNRRRD